MEYSNNKILAIDISSHRIKVGLVSDQLKLESFINQDLIIVDEDIDGFAKRFDMKDLWNKIQFCIQELLKKNKKINIIGISSCAQRIAVVFIDKLGEVIYGGPNIDVRGIDSAYLIEDEFSEEELFNITGHSPSILFCLSRLLWFKEEEEELYKKINKVLMLDDWIVYKLTGEICSDLTSASESQILDIKKGKWSSEIIDAFNFDPDFFPKFIDSGTIIGELKSELVKYFDLKKNSIPVIKTGGDTQATLLGMGVIEDGNVGISLGSTGPLHIVVNEPILDPKYNHWTLFHSLKGKWLIEGNPGNTGIVYDWLKEHLLKDLRGNKDSIIEEFLKKEKQGSGSTFAFLGPDIMNIKDQTTIKRGVFVFPPPTLVSEDLPTIENFVRSSIENICYGILENFKVLPKFTKSKITTFCAGGIAKSNEILKILSNILKENLNIPTCRDSAFIGCAMNSLIGLKMYADYKTIIKELINFDKITFDPDVSNYYEQAYVEWKNLKKKVNEF
ncbi:MAG: FGGY family carbohydrate kinase [Candidatus Hodarchaeota archaeon]